MDVFIGGAAIGVMVIGLIMPKLIELFDEAQGSIDWAAHYTKVTTSTNVVEMDRGVNEMEIAA